jgi:hypothetical protein
MAGGAERRGDEMRYDRGYGRDYGGRMGGMPQYDAMFRGRERHMGPPQGRRGRDAGRMGWRDLGPAPHEGWSQHPAPGETDFLGRPYPPQAMDDRPWGLIGEERRQAWAGDRGYDRGFRGGYSRDYDRDLAARRRYQMEGRPEDYHPRFMPDSDEAGIDVHRYGRGGDMRYNSSWTRWF